MKIRNFTIVAAMWALMAPAAVQAQQPPAPVAGFSAETLVTELSLFLPGDINLLGGAGRAGAGNAAQGGAAAGAAQGGQRTAGTGAAGAIANQFRIEKDPKLAFTSDQIAKLIPVFEGLEANPMPSPSSAKKIQTTVDSILTKAQKAGIEAARKAREEMMKQFQTRMQQAGAAAGGAAGAASAAGQGGQFRQGAAEGGADSGGQGGAQGAARPQATPAERRARVVEAFLAALQEAQKGAKK